MVLEFGFVEFGFEFIGYEECVDLRVECKSKRFIGFVDCSATVMVPPPLRP